MTKTALWLIAAALPVVRDCPDTPSDRAADGQDQHHQQERNQQQPVDRYPGEHNHSADQRDSKRFGDQHHDIRSVSHAQQGVSKKTKTVYRNGIVRVARYACVQRWPFPDLTIGALPFHDSRPLGTGCARPISLIQ
jgi:hypothetical protein